jgi:hypothetical protein
VYILNDGNELKDKHCRLKWYLARSVERSSFSNGADQAVVECNGVLDERSGLNRYQSKKKKDKLQ